jgi:hypothetical protein
MIRTLQGVNMDQHVLLSEAERGKMIVSSDNF